MINIFRKIEGDGLTAQVAIGRTKAYIDLTEDEKIDSTAIGQAAQAMGGESAKAVSDYYVKRLSMTALSQEMHKRVIGVCGPVPDTAAVETMAYTGLAKKLLTGGVLTHAEIHWLDWFLRKHKLTGGNNAK